MRSELLQVKSKIYDNYKPKLTIKTYKLPLNKIANSIIVSTSKVFEILVKVFK